MACSPSIALIFQRRPELGGRTQLRGGQQGVPAGLALYRQVSLKRLSPGSEESAGVFCELDRDLIGSLFGVRHVIVGSRLSDNPAQHGTGLHSQRIHRGTLRAYLFGEDTLRGYEFFELRSSQDAGVVELTAPGKFSLSLRQRKLPRCKRVRSIRNLLIEALVHGTGMAIHPYQHRATLYVESSTL